MVVPLLLSTFVMYSCISNASAGVTSDFVRNEWPSVDIPLEDEVFAVPKGYNAPQQVHITQGDYDGKAVIISWVTADEPRSNTVRHGLSEGKYDFTADGTVQNYTFYNYKSSYIHQCLVDGLQYSTKYYYEIGSGDSSRRFWFQTPPEIDPDTSYKFGIIVKYTPQWRWLAQELKHVDREKTPWLIVLMHAPIYNSNDAHFMEGESMRVVFESLFVTIKPMLFMLVMYMPTKDRTESRTYNTMYRLELPTLCQINRLLFTLLLEMEEIRKAWL